MNEGTEAKQTRVPMPPKLAAAFIKAQKAMKPAVKDCINPHFNSKYASLAAIEEALTPFLENDIGHYYRVRTTSTSVAVVAVLVHGESGESYDSEEFEIPVPQKTAQAFGSAASYGKRYTISALTGVVADDDDDGNAVSKPAPASKPKGTTPTNERDTIKALEASIEQVSDEAEVECKKRLSVGATEEAVLEAWKGLKPFADRLTPSAKARVSEFKDDRIKALKAKGRRIQIVDGAEVAS